MTDQDIKDLRAYIFSLPAVSQANKPHDVGFPFNIRLLQIGWRMLFFDKGVYQPDNQQNAIWNRGGYLVQALSHCSECHTPRNMFGGLDVHRDTSPVPRMAQKVSPHQTLELCPNKILTVLIKLCKKWKKWAIGVRFGSKADSFVICR